MSKHTASFSRLLAQLAAASRTIAVFGAAGFACLVGYSWSRAVTLMVAVALGGCAVLPQHVERPVSYARSDVADTGLAKIAAASTSGGDRELSGFRLLPDGAQAFDARIALIRSAEKTLDVQYYLIASDGSGREFLRELQAAAARGVRVRILVDDLYATGQDELFAGLAAHDNVAVRMFNPLPVRQGGFARRIVLSMHQFSRINHRMHNKLFIADGSFAVTGGRNIADEYFDRSGAANFIDMDVLSAGPVVRELAKVFDRYWNSDVVYPIASLVVDAPSARAFDAQVAAAPVTAPTKATIATELSAGRLELEPAAAEVYADAPRKALGDADATIVAPAHLALLGSAQSQVLLASPYFVPGEPALQALAQMRARDVGVSVLTNSLATTDEPLVHYGYARHRESLLSEGVELHELMPTAASPVEAQAPFGSSGRGASLGRLHTKLAVVDGESTFVGSMNMDARSDRLNTEAGIVIHSATLARRVASFLRRHEREGSYRVQLQGERLTWLSDDGRQDALSAEPEAAAKPALALRVVAQMLGEGVL